MGSLRVKEAKEYQAALLSHEQIACYWPRIFEVHGHGAAYLE